MCRYEWLWLTVGELSILPVPRTHNPSCIWQMRYKQNAVVIISLSNRHTSNVAGMGTELTMSGLADHRSYPTPNYLLALAITRLRQYLRWRMWSVSGPQHRHRASVGGLFPEATSKLATGRVACIFGGRALQFDLLHTDTSGIVRVGTFWTCVRLVCYVLSVI